MQDIFTIKVMQVSFMTTKHKPFMSHQSCNLHNNGKQLSCQLVIELNRQDTQFGRRNYDA